MSDFCILRATKLKTLTNIKGSAKHTLREVKTFNADPARKNLNEDSIKTSAEIVDAFKKEIRKIRDEGHKVKSTSVPCVEYFFGASPNAKVWGGNEANFFRTCRHWLEEKHGKENVISFHIQRDETTPHAVAYVLPRTKDGRLSAKEVMGNAASFKFMQTSFAERVKKYGLVRGVEGSKTKHQSIKDYYARVKAPLPPCPTPFDALTSGKRQEAVKTLHAQAQEFKAKAKKLNEAKKAQSLKIQNLEKMIEIQKTNEALLKKAVARLVKNSYTRSEFASVMGVELVGKQDVFDALIKSGQANDFSMAVALVATKMPPKNGGNWEDLAKFAVDLEDANPASAPAVQSKVKRGMGL